MWVVSLTWLDRLATWSCSQWSTSLDRLSVGPFTHDAMGRPGEFVNVLWILGTRWN